MWSAKWIILLTLFGAIPSHAQIVLSESFASETSDLSAPDRSIATGPQSLVLVDADVTIRDKAGAIIASKNIYQFFLPVTTVGIADPDVIFDPWSNRFFVSAIHGGEPQTCTLGNCVSLVSLAVSKTSTPTKLDTSDWYFYIFDTTLDNSTPTTNFIDAPKLGVDENILVFTGHMLSVLGDPTISYVKIRILDKSKLIAGMPVTTWTDFVNMTDPRSGGT